MLSNRTALLALVAGGALAFAHSAQAATYYDVITGDSPAGYWRLGEAAGATQAQDASPNNRDLNYNNAPASGFFGEPGAIVGDLDTAVKFTPGSPNPTISSPNTTDFGFALGQSFSAEYWIKALPGNSMTGSPPGLLTKGYDSSQSTPWYLSRYHSDGRVDWFLRGPDRVVTSTATVNDGGWHHVVGVYDSAAGQSHLYVDGRWQGTVTDVAGNPYGTNLRPFTIANHLNRNVDAFMDEVAMYDSALSADQVVEHYGTGAHAALLNVDFGSSSAAGPRQSGFFEFEDTEAGGNPPVIRTFTPVGAEGPVDVKISGYTHFRDYSAVGGAHAFQSDLLSDMVLRNADGTMKLTLDNLHPGTYEIKTYHHQSVQSGNWTLDIRLYDATAPNQIVADDLPVSTGTNPSSISTQTFQFTAGGSSVVIDFLGGADSQHLPLNGFELELIEPSRPVYKSNFLRIDFNDRSSTGSAYTQAGFNEFVLTDSNGGTQSYGGIDVTLSRSNSGALDDRRRGDPTDGGAFTQQELLRDSVFAATTTETDDGLDVLIEGLVPGERYEATIWSFDDGSGGDRRSDWLANGVLVMDDYVFNGSYDPLSDGVYQFSFLADADASGNLLISGREAGGTSPNVFIDALTLSRVRPIPEPSTFVLAAVGLLGLGFVVRRRRVRV